MIINTRFNVGDHVSVYNQRKGIIRSVSVNEFDDIKYQVQYTDTNEEKWYLEHHLNILVGDVYLTE